MMFVQQLSVPRTGISMESTSQSNQCGFNATPTEIQEIAGLTLEELAKVWEDKSDLFCKRMPQLGISSS